MPDPYLEIRGSRSPKKFLVGLKIKWWGGGGPGPPRPLPLDLPRPMETFSVNPDLTELLGLTIHL